MFWKLTNNSWLDNLSERLMHCRIEMDSWACNHSPLTQQEKEKIVKHLESCGRIINRHASKKIRI